MSKKTLFIKDKANVPLLEQEKIRSVSFDKMKKQNISFDFLYKGILTMLSLLVVISVAVVVCLICKKSYDEVSQGSKDKHQTEIIESTQADATDSVLDVTLPTDTQNKDGENEGFLSLEELYEFDDSNLGDGQVGIIPMDLSQVQNGFLRINNLTGLNPNLEKLIEKDFKTNDFYMLSSNDEPCVLIVHTHASDTYVYEGEDFCEFKPLEDFARTDDLNRNMISIGKIIAAVLNKNGISTVHCTTLHDSLRYKDSYSRSETTIKEYLLKYPSIRFVIDIGRDSLVSSGGDIIRPVTLVNNMPTAQVLCAVGSGWSGDDCQNWQDNLSIALKLCEKLNLKYSNFCRPVELLPHTYNQELSKYSIALKIGSSGNSFEEARRAAEIVAGALSEILKTIPF